MKKADFASALSALPVPDLTDEEWEARDAEIRRAREAEQRAALSDRDRLKRSAYQASGFPLRAIDAAIAATKTPAIERVTGWEAANRPGYVDSILVLSGPAGCGKTVAAVWWAWHCARSPVFLRSTTLAASSRYDRDERATWIGASSMVLDDLGTEYADSKGNYQVDLDELFDVFYGDRKPLIVTTNCTKEEFAARYGGRVMDRLRECGSWFSIKSESMRRKS